MELSTILKNEKKDDSKYKRTPFVEAGVPKQLENFLGLSAVGDAFPNGTLWMNVERKGSAQDFLEMGGGGGVVLLCLSGGELMKGGEGLKVGDEV